MDRGVSCASTPAQSSRNTNCAADPSRIGGSGPSTSTTTLSMPQPASAAMTCSTVLIRAPSCASTVESRVSATQSKRAGMSAPISVRRKTMPWSVVAGRKVRLTRCPECRPTPTQPIGDFSVCWHHVVVSEIQHLWQAVHTPRLLLSRQPQASGRSRALASQCLFLSVSSEVLDSAVFTTARDMPALRRLTPEKCRYVEPDLVSGGLAHGRARLFDPGLLHCGLSTHGRRLPLCCWRRLPPPEGPRDRAEQAGPGWFGARTASVRRR